MDSAPARRAPPYRQLILTLWREDDRRPTGMPRWRLSLQNPRTAERIGFGDVAELATFLQAWMMEQRADNIEEE